MQNTDKHLTQIFNESELFFSNKLASFHFVMMRQFYGLLYLGKTTFLTAHLAFDRILS